MTIRLKDVLGSDNVRIHTISEHKSGGTFLRFTAHKCQVPSNLREEWRVPWVKLLESGRRSLEEEQTVEVIFFKKTPFEFLMESLGCKPKKILSYMGALGDCNVRFWWEVDFGQFTFETKSARATPSEEVHRYLAKVLGGGHCAGKYPILRQNQAVLSGLFERVETRQLALDFSFEDFYYERIGDATGLDEVDWSKMILTQCYLLTQNLPKENRGKPADPSSLDSLVERFSSQRVTT